MKYTRKGTLGLLLPGVLLEGQSLCEPPVVVVQFLNPDRNFINIQSMDCSVFLF